MVDTTRTDNLPRWTRFNELRTFTLPTNLQMAVGDSVYGQWREKPKLVAEELASRNHGTAQPSKQSRRPREIGTDTICGEMHDFILYVGRTLQDYQYHLWTLFGVIVSKSHLYMVGGGMGRTHNKEKRVCSCDRPFGLCPSLRCKS